MRRINLLKCLMILSVFVFAIGCNSSMDLTSGLNSGMGAVKTVTLSDDDVKNEAQQAIEAYDQEHEVAPPGNRYAKRLTKLTEKNLNYDGGQYNFKVYITDEVNAFAMADGSIRVYSGLMDMMNDNELLFVIGHEMGHVKLGHRKKALKVAYASATARDAAQASGNDAAVIADSALGDFAEKLINAQFSQEEERQADDYGFDFLKENKDKAHGAVSALEKLTKLGSSNGIFSSHPDPQVRADRLKARL